MMKEPAAAAFLYFLHPVYRADLDRYFGVGDQAGYWRCRNQYFQPDAQGCSGSQ